MLKHLLQTKNTIYKLAIQVPLKCKIQHIKIIDQRNQFIISITKLMHNNSTLLYLSTYISVFKLIPLL